MFVKMFQFVLFVGISACALSNNGEMYLLLCIEGFVKAKLKKLALVRFCYLQPNASCPVQPLFYMPMNFISCCLSCSLTKRPFSVV